MMPGVEAEITSVVDGGRLHARGWFPDGQETGALVIAHGFQEHSGRYDELAAMFTGKGFAVFAIDHRGHGKSEGGRAFFNEFSDLVNDFRSVVGGVLTYYASGVPDERGKLSTIMTPNLTPPPKPSPLPVFVLGHSMGGLITASMLVHHPPMPLRGVVLSSPLLNFAEPPPGCLVPVLRCCAKCCPKTSGPKISSDFLSHDKEEVQKYDTDPLNSRVPACLHVLAEFEGTMKRVRKDFGSLRVNALLILHGACDKITSCKTSQKMAKVKFTHPVDLRFVEYPQGYHELFNERRDIKEKATSDLLTWVVDHAGSA